MTEFEKQIADMAKRYEAEAKELKRSLRNLSTGERLCAQTHANCKEAGASELRRIMLRCGVKPGARA
jgi:hypothetical protein